MTTGRESALQRWRGRLRRVLARAVYWLFGHPDKFQRYYSREDWPSGGLGVMEWLNARFQYAVDRLLKRVPPRTGEAYLTHIPVLVALGRSLQAKRILELGCGYFSTLTFLDRDCFEHLERLDSVENYRDWAEKVEHAAAGDPRFKMHVVEGPLADALGGFDLESYDLIFVDDALTREERSRTITTLAHAELRRAVVAIHDYDMLAYRRAALAYPSRYRFTALYPNTGVVWKGRDFNPSKIHAMDRTIGALRDKGQVPTDPQAAAAFFKSQARSL